MPFGIFVNDRDRGGHLLRDENNQVEKRATHLEAERLLEEHGFVNCLDRYVDATGRRLTYGETSAFVTPVVDGPDPEVCPFCYSMRPFGQSCGCRDNGGE